MRDCFLHRFELAAFDRREAIAASVLLFFHGSASSPISISDGPRRC
jgi:hypothetical protein